MSDPTTAHRPSVSAAPPAPAPAASRVLDGIRDPADVKALSHEQLVQLAQEIRDELIHVTSVNGLSLIHI